VRRTIIAAVLFALVAGSIGAPAAFASAPTNDNFADATIVGAFPFSDSVDITQATSEPGESTGCAGSGRTVWYTFTAAASGVVTVNPAASTFFDAMVNVYSSSGAPSLGSLTLIACNSSNSAASFAAEAGATYYVQASDYYTGGGVLNISFSFAPPPPNDDFANAAVIGSLPYSDTTDNSAATSEAGEPSCGYGLSNGSVWYAYTPATSGAVTASITASFFATVGVYEGSSLGSLTQIACTLGPPTLGLQLVAGTTYYFQVAGVGGTGPITFQVATPGPPVADFGWSPTNPSTFDLVSFYDNSSDPGYIGFGHAHWSFGDGASAEGNPVTHRYQTDGDYSVTITATTLDGRTAATTHVVSVRTHDLAIAKFTVPVSGRAGQSRAITIGVSNHRYPESGVVSLWKGAFPNDQIIGQLEGVNVPVLAGGRTTSFTFTYTFTPEDAAAGKVTFRAVVGIWVAGIPDAYPADNSAIATTRVTR
jgi:hypothetical protein